MAESIEHAKARLIELLGHSSLYIHTIGVSTAGTYNKSILQCYVIESYASTEAVQKAVSKITNVNLYIANALKMRRDQFGNIKFRTQQDLVEELTTVLNRSFKFERL